MGGFLMPSELAELASAVRTSTLKRLRRVPMGLENWRVDRDAMSFADVAQHLIDADAWLFEKLRNPSLAAMVGRPYSFEAQSRDEYEALLKRLQDSGESRSAMLLAYSDDELSRRIPDSRFEGLVSVWWVVVRGNLDHEIHHRGQIIAYLRINGVHEPLRRE